MARDCGVGEWGSGLKDFLLIICVFVQSEFFPVFQLKVFFLRAQVFGVFFKLTHMNK